MALVRLWQSKERCKLIDPDTLQEETIIIPGINLLESKHVEDILLWQEDQVQRQFQEAMDHPKPVMTKEQQHDLGDTLYEIKESRERRAESLHGRFF